MCNTSDEQGCEVHCMNGNGRKKKLHNRNKTESYSYESRGRWEATEQARAQSSSCAYMTRSTTIKLNSAETCKNLEITTCYLSTYHKSRLFSIKLSLFFFFLCHDEMINLITLKRRHSSLKAMMMMRSFFCCARARAISEEFNFPRTYGGFLSLIGIWFFDPPDFSPESWLSSLSETLTKICECDVTLLTRPSVSLISNACRGIEKDRIEMSSGCEFLC